MANAVIEVEDLHKTYNLGEEEVAVRAVDGISFRVERGESV